MVISFTYPIVAKGQARLRNQISAGHSFEEIDQCVKAYKYCAAKIGL